MLEKMLTFFSLLFFANESITFLTSLLNFKGPNKVNNYAVSI